MTEVTAAAITQMQVTKALRPKSVAIIGMSTKPGSASQNVLSCLRLNDFSGPIHLVGRGGEPIDGRPVLADIQMLPLGIDLAVLAVPAQGVREAIEACIAREVGTAMVFAAGFAESGDRSAQEEVSRIARDGGLALVGPNCIGYANWVDGFMVQMLRPRVIEQLPTEETRCVAFVGQSGGLLGHMQRAAAARAMPMSYVVSTGNEAGLDLADFTEFLVDDLSTSLIVLYAEQIKRPAQFLAAARRARAAGKPVVLMHPGRSRKGRAAAATHTGSLVGDYGAMRVQIEHAGILLVDELDELMDVSELLLKFPTAPTQGPAIMTASGAFVALANDFAEELGMDFPALAAETLAKAREALPPFANPANPLDVTASCPLEGLEACARALADDPNTGSVLVSIPVDGRAGAAQRIANGLVNLRKPAVIAALGDSSPLSQEILDAVATSGACFWRSSDRALRALGLITRHGQSLSPANAAAHAPLEGLPGLGAGTLPEWRGKQLLAAAGLRVPEGALARSLEEGLRVAARIGYPVVLKAQAGALAHKTEAGGVVLNVRDEAGLRSEWIKLLESVRKSAPDVELEGVLVEQMASKGLELMVGAKRDPQWGPIVLFGLGGVWVEAIGDVRMLPIDASEPLIVQELLKLKSSRLLTGFRGAPPVDLDAVARAVRLIGQLMHGVPEILEIDVNPLVVFPKGQGVLALDALVVTG